MDGLAAELELTAIGCRLRLAEVYEQVSFSPPDASPVDTPPARLIGSHLVLL